MKGFYKDESRDLILSKVARIYQSYPKVNLQTRSCDRIYKRSLSR